MRAKSDSTTAFSGNGCPRFGAKGPYETPRAKNLRSPSQKNMPDVRMRSTADAAPSLRPGSGPDRLGGLRERDPLASRRSFWDRPPPHDIPCLSRLEVRIFLI